MRSTGGKSAAPSRTALRMLVCRVRGPLHNSRPLCRGGTAGPSAPLRWGRDDKQCKESLTHPTSGSLSAATRSCKSTRRTFASVLNQLCRRSLVVSLKTDPLPGDGRLAFDTDSERLLVSDVRAKAFPPRQRPRRLARPRTSPFHGGNTGSNPVGDAKIPKQLRSSTVSPENP